MTASLSTFLEAFESGTLPKAEWTHAAHLKMACLYLHRMSFEEALVRIRRGIRHYNECQGVENSATSGYHETLTVFWCRIVSGFMKSSPAGESLEETIVRL